MDTTLLTGATLADGTGRPLRLADVLLTGDRITAVEEPGVLPRDRPVRDLEGLVLAPGFIDTHSHADNAPLLADDDTTKVRQGITTEVVGNCGFSLAPRSRDHGAELDAFTRRLFPPIEFTWSTFGELTAALDDAGYVTHHCPLVGHGTLRIAATGMTDAAPDEHDLRRMRHALEEAMHAGAFGLSSGLVYPPAVFSETAELLLLAEVLGGHGLYATHMRDEGAGLPDSLDEALRIGAIAGRTHVSHLKAAGDANWGSMPRALAVLRHARERGATVTQDVYPYTASSTMLTSTLPSAYLAGGAHDVLHRLYEDRDRLTEILGDELPGREPDRILIAGTASHRHEGRTLREIAEATDTGPVDALLNLLITEELQATMVLFSMHEDDLLTALGDENTMIGSDGLPPGSGGKPHPRLFGTFPRLLSRYTRGGLHEDTGTPAPLDLPEAIRRVTSLPAATFRIPARGVVAPGHIADLVAFDPAAVADVGNYRDPVHSPHGIAWVCLAGRTVMHHGQYIGGRHGRRLSPTV